MARYLAPVPGLEVLGISMNIFLAVMREHPTLAKRLYARHNLKDREPTGWYPLQQYLDIYSEVDETIGSSTLFSIGKQVPSHAAWPPGINDIVAGLASIDVAYHLNHRLNGQVMFDEKTGRMLEGMGHYASQVVGKRRIHVICDTPYPAEFDRGIVTAVARKFQPSVEVVRDAAQPSRLAGGKSCTFVATW